MTLWGLSFKEMTTKALKWWLQYHRKNFICLTGQVTFAKANNIFGKYNVKQFFKTSKKIAWNFHKLSNCSHCYFLCLLWCKYLNTHLDKLITKHINSFFGLYPELSQFKQNTIIRIKSIFVIPNFPSNAEIR